MTVIDASVALKWLFPEAGQPEARRLRDSGGPLAAPALIRVEVPAAIAGKVRLYGVELQEAEAALALWDYSVAEGILALIPDEAHLPEAFRLAVTLRHPLQDCLYLAAAKDHAAPLITADAKFAAKARSSYPNVRLLSES